MIPDRISGTGEETFLAKNSGDRFTGRARGSPAPCKKQDPVSLVLGYAIEVSFASETLNLRPVPACSGAEVHTRLSLPSLDGFTVMLRAAP